MEMEQLKKSIIKIIITVLVIIGGFKIVEEIQNRNNQVINIKF